MSEMSKLIEAIAMYFPELRTRSHGDASRPLNYRLLEQLSRSRLLCQLTEDQG